MGEQTINRKRRNTLSMVMQPTHSNASRCVLIYVKVHRRLTRNLLDHFICARENVCCMVFGNFYEMLPNEGLAGHHPLLVERFKRYSFICDLMSQDLRDLLECLTVGVLFETKHSIDFPSMG